MADITDDIRWMVIAAGITLITGHKIDELKFVVFSGKVGHQDVGFGYIFLPDFVIRGDLNSKFSPSFSIKDLGEYGWRIEAGKAKPLDACVMRNQGGTCAVSNYAVIQVFHSGFHKQ
jgi:hypothetical protein